MRLIICAIVALLTLSDQSIAHPPMSGVAEVTIHRDGRFVLTLRHDAIAFALGQSPVVVTDDAMLELLNGPESEIVAAFERSRCRLAEELRLVANGAPISLELTSAPSLESLRAWQREHVSKPFPVALPFELRTTLPAGTSAITLRFPPILGDVIWTVERPDAALESVPLRPGAISPDIAVSVTAENASDDVSPVATRVEPIGAGIVVRAWRYMKFGFEHIIPDGADHAFFVLGLFLLSPRFKIVLWQITAFTVAHTLTLTLTTLNLISLPNGIVEPVIALSIAFIAVENLVTTKVHAWRPVVAFLFGLVHGMGVASAFCEAGFPTVELVMSLTAFTLGVEAGHLAVLTVAFLGLSWWRDRPWYRAVIVIPLSLVIAIVALCWTVQRLM